MSSLSFFEAQSKFSKLHNVDGDEENMFFHILECISLVSRVLMNGRCMAFGDSLLSSAKCRVFWKSIAEIANLEATATELEVKAKDFDQLPIYKVLKCFPDQSKRSDGRLWLPLHFAASLPNNNLSDFQVIYDSKPDCMKQILTKRESLNPLHLIAMMQNPPPETIQKLSIYHAAFLPTSKSTPLHMAVRFSNSIEMVQELLRLNPQSVKMKDAEGCLPLHRVGENNNPAAAKILQVLLAAAPETACKKDKNGQHPLIYFLRSKSPLQDMIPYFLEANKEAVNIRDSFGQYPIHVAAWYSTLENFKLIAEANMEHLRAMTNSGSVAHMAVRGNKLDILRYIHSLAPELLLSVDNKEYNPMQVSVMIETCDATLVKALYALEPRAAAVTSKDKFTLLHHIFYGARCLDLDDPMSDGAEVLRFLLRILPDGLTAENEHGETPYDSLVSNDQFFCAYGRRVVLQAAPKTFEPKMRRALNYLARRNVLLALFGKLSAPNIFTSFARVRGGDVLMIEIVRFL